MNRTFKIKTFMPKILSIIFMLVCFTVIYEIYGVYYLSNDDTGIMKTFSGYNTGVPTPYHQYGSYTLGLFYKLLYTLLPSLNWYTFFSILTVIVSNAVIIYTIFAQEKINNYKFRYLNFALIGILVVAVSMYGIGRISWTMNGLFASTAGLMILMNMPNEGKERYQRFITACSFFFIGMMIRGSSYKASLPYIIMAIIYKAYCSFAAIKGTKAKKILVEAVIFLVAVFGIYYYGDLDSALKGDIFSAEISSFDYYRGLYTDWPHIPFEENEEFYESLGWDEEFYNVTGEWMFIDRRFTEENLKKIAEASRELKENEIMYVKAQAYITDFLAQTKGNSMRICMSCGMMFLLVFAVVKVLYELRKKKNCVEWIFMAGIQALAFAECLYLLWRGRIIDRAFYCAVLPALFIGIWVMAKHANYFERYKKLYYAVWVLSIGVFIASVKQNLSFEKSEIERQKIQVSSDADKIYFANPENLYIYDTTIISGCNLFLDMSLRGCGQNSLMWGGTGVFSKSFYEMVGRFGYDEFYSNNLFDENVYYITTNDKVDDSTFMVYMKKMYGFSVYAELEQKAESGVCVYKFHKE